MLRPVATGGARGAQPPWNNLSPPPRLPAPFAVTIGIEVYPPLEFCQPPLLTIYLATALCMLTSRDNQKETHHRDTMPYSSTSGKGSFICPVIQTRLDIPRPLITQLYRPLGGKSNMITFSVYISRPMYPKQKRHYVSKHSQPVKKEFSANKLNSFGMSACRTNVCCSHRKPKHIIVFPHSQPIYWQIVFSTPTSFVRVLHDFVRLFRFKGNH